MFMLRANFGGETGESRPLSVRAERGEVVDWVDGLARALYLEVEVRAGGVSRLSDVCDGLANLDFVARSDVDTRGVGVARDRAVVAFDVLLNGADRSMARRQIAVSSAMWISVSAMSLPTVPMRSMSGALSELTETTGEVFGLFGKLLNLFSTRRYKNIQYFLKILFSNFFCMLKIPIFFSI